MSGVSITDGVTADGVVYSKDASGNITGLVGAGGVVLPMVDRTLILVNGDSFEARHTADIDHAQFTAAQVGGVATITQASHTILPGTVIHMGGWTDPKWNGYFTVLPTGLTAGSFTFAIDPSADATPTQGNYTPNFTVPTQKLMSGFMNWAEWLTGMDFNYRNIALGSRKSADFLAEFETDVVRYGPANLCIIGGFTNDANQAIPLATTSAAIQTMISSCIAKKITPVLVTTPFFAAPANTTAKANAVLAIHAEMRKLALLNGVEIWDWAEVAADPAGTATTQVALLDADGIHPTPLMSKLIAETQIIPYLMNHGYGSPMPLISSVGDVRATQASSSNIVAAMTGTAGTVAGGATGQALTGWTFTNASLTTCVGSVVPGSVNSKQVVDWSYDGSGSDNFTLAGPDFKASMVSGKRYVFYGRIHVKNPVASRLSAWIKFSTAAGNFNLQALSTQGSALPCPAGNYTITFQTDPDGWLYSSSDFTLTLAQLNAQFLPVSAGAGRVEFEMFTVREC